ncbi:hypothetical protein HDU97_001414, partial [Phlyctochytrium planicorne]
MDHPSILTILTTVVMAWLSIDSMMATRAILKMIERLDDFASRPPGRLTDKKI